MTKARKVEYASFRISEHANPSGDSADGRELRFGDRLFVRDDSRRLANEKTLYLIRQKGRLFEACFPDVEIVHDAGRFLAISATDDEYAKIREHSSHCFAIDPLPDAGTVFTRRPHRASPTRTAAWVQALVDRITAADFLSALEKLTSFPTRHSQTPHFIDAANECIDVLLALGFEAELQGVPLGSQTTFNVVAKKPGNGTDKQLVIAMAHLDSINIHGNAESAAPGADDNGSGSAGVLEIARVFADHNNVNDFRLILFGGEELGLFGSKHFVSTMSDEDKARLSTAVNMDMIGGNNLPEPAVLIEAGDQAVIDEIADAADRFTSLAVEASLNPFASDHVPFIDAGLPAALTIEGADSGNDKIHTANDTMQHVDAELARQILRMNVGFIAQKLDKADA